MNWRMMGAGLVVGISLYSFFFLFLGPVPIGAMTFFGLILVVECVAILLAASPTNQSSSTIRGLFEWIVIGVVWIMISLIVLGVLNLLLSS